MVGAGKHEFDNDTADRLDVVWAVARASSPFQSSVLVLEGVVVAELCRLPQTLTCEEFFCRGLTGCS